MQGRACRCLSDVAPERTGARGTFRLAIRPRLMTGRFFAPVSRSDMQNFVSNNETRQGKLYSKTGPEFCVLKFPKRAAGRRRDAGLSDPAPPSDSNCGPAAPWQQPAGPAPTAAPHVPEIFAATDADPARGPCPRSSRSCGLLPRPQASAMADPLAGLGLRRSGPQLPC